MTPKLWHPWSSSSTPGKIIGFRGPTIAWRHRVHQSQKYHTFLALQVTYLTIAISIALKVQGRYHSSGKTGKTTFLPIFRSHKGKSFSFKWPSIPHGLDWLKLNRMPLDQLTYLGWVNETRSKNNVVKKGFIPESKKENTYIIQSVNFNFDKTYIMICS